MSEPKSRSGLVPEIAAKRKIGEDPLADKEAHRSRLPAKAGSRTSRSDTGRSSAKAAEVGTIAIGSMRDLASPDAQATREWLLAHLKDNWIAIAAGKLVDADPRYEVLIDRLAAQNLLADAELEFVSTEPPAAILPG
jgi:hypothetical protein